MRVVGVDPGLSGAVALLDDEELLDAWDIQSADGAVMAGALTDVLATWNPDLVVVEAVHSMPGQGVSTTFKFGRALGTVEGIVAALGYPVAYIAPHTWKSAMKVTRDKASSRALASRLWPRERARFARVKDDGRAEAALLAVAYLRRARQVV